MSGFSFVILKVIQARFGQVFFDNYILILRYSGFIVPFIMLGMGVSIPRHISFIRHNSDSTKDKNSVVETGIVIVLLAIFITFLISFFLANFFEFNKLLFNGHEYFFILIMYCAGLALFSSVYSVMRGFEEFKLIESLKICLIGIPALFFIFYLKTLTDYLYVYTVLNCIVFIFVFWYKNINININIKIESAVLVFGLKRVIGDVTYPLLVSIPIIYTVNSIGYESAAKFSFYIMLVNIFVMFVNPISTIMLTKAVKIVNSKSKLLNYIVFSFILSIVLSIFFSILSPYIISYFGYSINKIDIFNLSIILSFLSIYICVRSIIDAESETPHLLIMTLVALFFEILYLLLIDYIGYLYIISSYFISFGILLILSLIRYYRIYTNAESV